MNHVVLRLLLICSFFTIKYQFIKHDGTSDDENMKLKYYSDSGCDCNRMEGSSSTLDPDEDELQTHHEVDQTQDSVIRKSPGDMVTLRINTAEDPMENYVWVMESNCSFKVIVVVTDNKLNLVQTPFGDRLKTNLRSRTITISNLTVGDSGNFSYQSLSRTTMLLQRFTLIITDVLYQKNVLEGNHVTLEAKKNKHVFLKRITWTWGEIYGGDRILEWKCDSNFSDTKPEFKHVVELNPKTGDLTFSSTLLNHTGLYWVEMTWSGNGSSRRRYQLSVYEPVPAPNITKGGHKSITAVIGFTEPCDFTCSVKNGPDVNLTWYEGELILSHISNPNISTLTLPLEIKSETETIYVCEAQNPVSTQRTTLNVTHWCSPGYSGWKFPIAAVVGGVIVFVVAGLVFQNKRSNGNQSNQPE